MSEGKERGSERKVENEQGESGRERDCWGREGRGVKGTLQSGNAVLSLSDLYICMCLTFQPLIYSTLSPCPCRYKARTVPCRVHRHTFL